MGCSSSPPAGFWWSSGDISYSVSQVADHVVGRTTSKRRTARIFTKKGRKELWDKCIPCKVTGFPGRVDMGTPPVLFRSSRKNKHLLVESLQDLQQLQRSQDLAGYASLLVTGAWVPVSCRWSARTNGTFFHTPSLLILQHSVIYTGCMSGLNRSI